MDDYTATIEKMQAVINRYRFHVEMHGKVTAPSIKAAHADRVEDMISLAAANGMSKDELDELAGVEW